MLKRNYFHLLVSLLVAIACLSFGVNALAQHHDGQRLRHDDDQARDDGHEQGDDEQEDRDNNARRFGPFRSTSPDGGSCGQQWATDMFDRFFKVTKNGNGTFRVREDFRNGVFVTTGPLSPGACETTDSRHGTAVLAGITGRFFGFLDGTVTSNTFNPNGCSTPGACTTTQGFLLATFGPAGPATFTCNNGFAGCKFDFHYFSNDPRLIFRHWEDRGTDGVNEIFLGDIATQ